MPDFNDCAFTTTTIPAVKSWYSDIEVLCTHFLHDAAVNLAPYAESIVDEDDTNINTAPQVEIVIDQEDPAIDPAPHVEVAVDDRDVSPAPFIEIVIDDEENGNDLRTSYDHEEVEEISTPDSEKETLCLGEV